MGVLDTAVDLRRQAYLDARTAMLAELAQLEAGLDAAREGGGEREVTRHHARGKLLARERLELLVDRDSPLLELSPLAGWGLGGPVGAAVVTAIGIVAGRPCVIIASDPTVHAAAAGAGTLRKIQRAQQIAHQNRLPVIGLLEANGTEPAGQADALGVAGEVVAGFAELARARIPTAAVWFGGWARLAGAELSDSFGYLIGIRPANGGHPAGAGTAPPGRTPDQQAEDERDALRLARRWVQRSGARPGPAPGGGRAGRFPASAVVPPKHDPEDLLAVPVDEPREILGRILDGSEFDEDQPGSGPAVCTGWADLYGQPVAVLASAGQPSGADEADKAVRFTRRAEAAGSPLLLLRHGTALWSPAEAVLAGAEIPLLVVRVGPWQGVGAAAARAGFRFAWPGASVTPAAPEGGAGPAAGAESALHRSGRLDDDGVIDPRDTRTVLGFCLSLIQRHPS